MSLIRVYDKSMTEVGILLRALSLEYTLRFREAGEITLLVRDEGYTVGHLSPDGFLQVQEGEIYRILSVERDLEKKTVLVRGEGILSLFGGIAMGEEYSLDGEVSALLLALARKGASVMPLTLTFGETVDGPTLHFDSGRSYLYGDMVGLSRAGGIGMRLTLCDGSLLFEPVAVRDRGAGSADPVILSGRLGTLSPRRYREDFSSYKNTAVVSGAQNGRGGRYTATVYRDEVDISDSFPDGEHGERQLLVNFNVPTSAYTVETAAGTTEFDYTSYLGAMRAAGAAALGRARPKIFLEGEIEGDIYPGDRVRLKDPVTGAADDGLAEAVRISYGPRGRRVTATVSVMCL